MIFFWGAGTPLPVALVAPLYRGLGNEEQMYAGWDTAGTGRWVYSILGSMGRQGGGMVQVTLSRIGELKRTAANGVSNRSSGTRELGRA